MLTTTVVTLMPTPKSLTCQEHEKRLREMVKHYDQRREPRWKREEQLRKALR